MLYLPYLLCTTPRLAVFFQRSRPAPEPHEKDRVFCADFTFVMRQKYKLFAVEPNKKAIILLLKN